jgi:hypothetical protein
MSSARRYGAVFRGSPLFLLSAARISVTLRASLRD